jgi:hypothetical protein
MVGSVKLEDCGLGQCRQKARPCLQNNQSKRAGGVAQMVESLPSRCEALSPNPSMAKKYINKYKLITKKLWLHGY